VNKDVYPICCDNPDENPQWCKVNGTSALPLQLAVAQGKSSEPLVPEKELTGCGGHKYLHGDWNKGNSKNILHITISGKADRLCDLKGDHHSYKFGMPHPHDHTDDRVFPICHSVDAQQRCVSQYKKCHVLVRAGSGCTAPEVMKKLNGAKWVEYHKQ